MEIYQTEEQQVDAIKSYWKDNGNSIIAGIVIGLAGYVGFNYYQDEQLAQEIAVSDAYQTVLEASAKDTKAFTAAGDAFIAENGKTVYSALTALALAKETATHKDWEQTAKYLAMAIETAPSEGIKAIATVRLARVQIQLTQIEQALTTLNTKLPESFTASVEEIKGDAYLQQGKTELARNAYQAAIDADGLATSSALQMKLDNLAVSDNIGNPVN